MNLPEIKGDQSSHATGIYMVQNGRRVPLEQVFKTGFIVGAEDCPMVLSLIAGFLKAKDGEGLSQ